jgi:UDP-3-O-[3-hydroxymyristoyl] glucosamine N-acyltransferase
MSDFKQGHNLTIGQFVVIEEGCEIGNNVTIEDFVVLKSGTIVGDECCIHAGAKIGTPTFTLSREKGKRQRIPSKGVTILEKGVDIGYNTVIQRGIERDTIIGENTFVNNLCNIGHDVQIGKECIIGLGVRMSGYTEIGTKGHIAPGVTILNRVKIGRNAFVGIGSLVLHDIADHTKVVGRPAIELNRYKYEKKALKSILGMDSKTAPIATRKGRWSRRFRRILYSIRPKSNPS